MEELQRLKDYFDSVEIPKGELKINAWATTQDLAFTIDSYFKKVEASNIFVLSATIALQGIEKFLKERI